MSNEMLTVEELQAVVAEAIATAIKKKNQAASIGKNDTAQRPGAGDTTAPKLRKQSGHDSLSDIRATARALAVEYRQSPKDHAATWVKMARRFGKIPGFSNHQAVTLARELFPGSYKDFCRRQEAGERLPILFTNDDTARRLKSALANGRLP